MKKPKAVPLPSLTDVQVAQLKNLDGRAPDTADIPEAPAENWRTARPFLRHAADYDTRPVGKAEWDEASGETD